MDKLVVVGGNKLSGDVYISGAKNAVLPIMTACLINPGNYKLNNVPNLRDTQTMIKLLRIIGADVRYDNSSLYIDTSKCDNPCAPYDLVKTMRASFYVLGPLLSRFHRSEVSLPGGCAWGPRPVDFHLKALKEMCVNIELSKGNIVATGRPIGADIHFQNKSVGATGNILMAAVKADGVTKIFNASKEPEIVSLGDFLNKMGARIEGLGTDNLVVYPIEIENNDIEFDIIPDRIEAGTFMIAVACVGGNVNIKNLESAHLGSLIDLFNKIDIDMEVNANEITIDSNGIFESFDIETLEYPGFPTDLQAQLMSMMVKAKGKSSIKENIYHDRFTHIPELVRLGAKVTLENETAYIQGVDDTFSAPVMCTDIRASAALVISALYSIGKTEISRVYHIDRGYDKIEEKLSAIGADIKRING